jgi:trans-2,3-dihydro-3-hydroxyanthranilate isomerase
VSVQQNGAIASVHVGGSCAPMMEGTFRLAGEG